MVLGLAKLIFMSLPGNEMKDEKYQLYVHKYRCDNNREDWDPNITIFRLPASAKWSYALMCQQKHIEMIPSVFIVIFTGQHHKVDLDWVLGTRKEMSFGKVLHPWSII